MINGGWDVPFAAQLARCPRLPDLGVGELIRFASERVSKANEEEGAVGWSDAAPRTVVKGGACGGDRCVNVCRRGERDLADLRASRRMVEVEGLATLRSTRSAVDQELRREVWCGLRHLRRVGDPSAEVWHSSR